MYPFSRKIKSVIRTIDFMGSMMFIRIEKRGRGGG